MGWLLIEIFCFVFGVSLLFGGLVRFKKAECEEDDRKGRSNVFFGIGLIILCAAVAVMNSIVAFKEHMLLLGMSDCIQESQVESEIESEMRLCVEENFAYAEGKIVDKHDNGVIQVSVNGEAYRLLVEKDVYDAYVVGDRVGCIVFLDDEDNIIGVYYAGDQHHKVAK